MCKLRLLMALRRPLLSGLGTAEQQAKLLTSATDASLDDFLNRFGSKSLKDPGECGFGPVACAAVAGNEEILRE